MDIITQRSIIPKSFPKDINLKLGHAFMYQCCGSACFGPPGSGYRSTSQRYGSESGSPFYNQAKLVRKTLIPTVLSLLYDFFSLWKMMCCKFSFKKSWKPVTKIAGSVNPDQNPYQNATDPQHWSCTLYDYSSMWKLFSSWLFQTNFTLPIKIKHNPRVFNILW